jgi:hypothetical protein
MEKVTAFLGDDDSLMGRAARIDDAVAVQIVFGQSRQSVGRQ